MYYIKNKTNGWRSTKRYETPMEAATSLSIMIDQIASTILEEKYKPDFCIMEEPINEEVNIEDYPIVRA